MALPQVVMTGNLVATPELRFTQAGKAVANFRIACSERKKEGDTWVDGAVTFLSVVVWEKTAEACAEHLDKGSKVTVVGRLSQRDYEKDGQKRTVHEVTADSVAKVLDTKTPAADPWAADQSTAPF